MKAKIVCSCNNASVGHAEHRRPPTIVAGLAAILLATSWGAIADAPPRTLVRPLPGAAQAGKPFFDRLRKLAGPTATDCGFVPEGRDTSAAIQCATQTNADQKPFWIATQTHDENSVVFNGAARDDAGKAWFMTFDLDAHVKSVLTTPTDPMPLLTQSPCAELQFSKEETPGVACRLQSWSAPLIKPFTDRLQQLAGPTTIACGLVRLDEDATEAIGCARRALQDGSLFWVAAEESSIDSTIFHGAARESDGTIWVGYFETDERTIHLPQEPKSYHPYVGAFPCREVRLSTSTEGRIYCGVAGRP
ncbi:MAG: hypothetical protein ABI411_21620 [Tahibacter sp.]